MDVRMIGVNSKKDGRVGKDYLINVSTQLIGRVFYILANFVVITLIARTLSTTDFGRYIFTISFVALFAQLSDFGTTAVFAKEIPQWKEDGSRFWGSFILLRSALGIAAIALALTAAFIMRSPFSGLLIIGAFCIPFVASRFFEPVYQVFQKPWYSTISQVSAAFILLIFNLAVFLSGGSAQGFVLAYLIPNILYVCVAFLLARRLLKASFVLDRQTVKGIMALALPIGVASIFTTVNTRADIFMLEYFKTEHEVGIYGGAYRFLDMMVNMCIIAASPLLPIFGKKAVEDRISLKKIYMAAIETIGIVIIPAAIAVPFFSGKLITLVYGPGFLEGAHALAILLPVGMLFSYSLLNTAFCVSIGVTHFGYWSAALAAIVNILLNYFWIPRFSYIGSAWATLVSELILISISFVYINRHMGLVFRPWPWAKIIIANICFGLLLHLVLPDLSYLSITASAVAYIILIIVMKLVPEEILAQLPGTLAGRFGR